MVLRSFCEKPAESPPLDCSGCGYTAARRCAKSRVEGLDFPEPVPESGAASVAAKRRTKNKKVQQIEDLALRPANSCGRAMGANHPNCLQWYWLPRRVSMVCAIIPANLCSIGKAPTADDPIENPHRGIRYSAAAFRVARVSQPHGRRSDDQSSSSFLLQ